VPRLSEREREIRAGRAIMARQRRDAGWSLEAIAGELRVSIRTVRRDLESSDTSVAFMPAPKPKRHTNVTSDSNVVLLRRQA